MTFPVAKFPSHSSMTLLSQLLLCRWNDEDVPSHALAGLKEELRILSQEEFNDLLRLADSNHVVVRGLERALEVWLETQDSTRADWARAALVTERARIATALMFLHEVCTALESSNCGVVVIKSLDHWPDLGSDLDLYTDATPQLIRTVMKRRFNAQIATRSVGDILAGKWNFLIPGLREPVEIHIGRLGQTGEQTAIAARILCNSRQIPIGDWHFRVPSVSDRIMISTLQRMYRHFYFRLCDIVDTATLSEAGIIDYEDLQSSAAQAGIWDGVATYLAIVSDYLTTFRGSGLALPEFVRDAARFGGDKVYYARGFLRVRILPQSVGLYRSQLAGLLQRRKFESSLRLSLLPSLALAAAIGQKVTGNDKGIW